jgi:exonuclease VII small subunit
MANNRQKGNTVKELNHVIESLEKRIVDLETMVKVFFKTKIEELEDRETSMDSKVDQIHEVFNQKFVNANKNLDSFSCNEC